MEFIATLNLIELAALRRSLNRVPVRFGNVLLAGILRVVPRDEDRLIRADELDAAVLTLKKVM